MIIFYIKLKELPKCYIPSFKAFGSVVLKKKIFLGVYHIWAWWSSWSCDLDQIIDFLPPFVWSLHKKFNSNWSSSFREEVI